jgi:hydrogenase expression/formation protein HypC
MCLGVPGKVVEIHENLAVCDFWGVKKQVRLEIVDEPVKVGDYILNHVGYAIRRIPEGSIADTLALYELLMREMNLEDAMAADVRGEIAAGGNA